MMAYIILLNQYLANGTSVGMIVLLTACIMWEAVKCAVAIAWIISRREGGRDEEN